jgi:hypothetical protein
MEGSNQRLRLKQIEMLGGKKDNFTIRVMLTGKDKVFEGERSGSGEENARLELAAEATLAAINSALAKKVSLKVKGINASEAFPGLTETLLVVVVEVDDDGEIMVMPGSCRNIGDSVEAAVKATLDDTNRVVELYLT